MPETNPMNSIQSELQKAMGLAKCRKCGCMKEALENLRSTVSTLQIEGSSNLLRDMKKWLERMEPIRYACLGCEYCFPAVAANIFHETFPRARQPQSLTCAFAARGETWPPVPGEYSSFCDGQGCPVAVSTLASTELSQTLANMRPKELCIVGKTETENIGIDKLVKNTITNPTIRFLLLAGKDPNGHHSGMTLLALWKNGVDDNMRVVGSPGRRPILRNVTEQEVETFRKQVQVVDLIGCEDVNVIVEKIRELSQGLSASYGCEESVQGSSPVHVSAVSVVQAKEPAKIEMDKAGYFVIIPQPNKGIITAEHYSYDNRLLRVIEGKDARSIYWTIIESGWVTQLSHAAYLGKELAKAKLSIELGLKYVQDAA